MRKYLSLLGGILLLCSCNTANAPKKVILKTLTEILEKEGIKKEELSLNIKKSDFTLEVLHADSVLKSFPMVLGGNPKGQKLMEGDLKTPEGKFKIRNLYPHNKWSKFIWVDYPTEESYKNHEAAKRNGLIPAEATIGGEIGIHGVPAGNDNWIDMRENWTLGCVSLKNSDIDEIYEVCFKGMDIIIQP